MEANISINAYSAKDAYADTCTHNMYVKNKILTSAFLLNGFPSSQSTNVPLSLAVHLISISCWHRMHTHTHTHTHKDTHAHKHTHNFFGRLMPP